MEVKNHKRQISSLQLVIQLGSVQKQSYDGHYDFYSKFGI